MDTNTYIERIQNIREQIRSSPEKALAQLDNMFIIKPIRQIWFIAKAEAMVQLGFSFDEIFSLLNDKFALDPPCEEVGAFFSITADKLDGVEEYIKQRHEFFVGLNKYLMCSSDENYVYVDKFYAKLSAVRNKFFKNPLVDNIIELATLYYITENQCLYLLLSLLYKVKVKNDDFIIAEWVKQLPNMGYLIERIISEDNNHFIIVQSDQDDLEDCKIAAWAINKLGKKVYLITLPIICSIEGKIDIEDTLLVSLENKEDEDGIIIFHAIELVFEAEKIGDNIEYIVSYITDNLTESHLATVLCSGTLFDELDSRPNISNHFQRLSSFKSEYLNKNIEFGWTGNYLSYIANIYGFDVRAEISKDAECDFSIVIPARNSSNTIKYTLETCLNQRFTGNYEIVLSDNSTEGNSEVYELYCELNDDKIKYYKTPRELSLPKSFEFAFLKAKGKFIFSLGSDDGIFPWALDIISKVLPNIPDDEILMWDRGFYAWPGFNYGQQNQFIIPGNYQKNKVNIHNVDSQLLLEQILNNPDSMYGLPMLYINSGFRRSYFQTLLKKTGRLWDGICQDIYMGIINVSINKTFPIIRYPLTIAGMTNFSMGLIANRAVNSNDEVNQRILQQFKNNNIGGYALTSLERLVPFLDTDRVSIYRSILRAICIGILPMDLLNKIDWEKTYKFMVQQLSIDDIQIDRKINWVLYSAELISKELKKYVKENIYPDLVIPRVLEESPNKNEKLYTEGFMASGGLTLDASKFGVTNVYEAALLFEKLTGL